MGLIEVKHHEGFSYAFAAMNAYSIILLVILILRRPWPVLSFSWRAEDARWSVRGRERLQIAE